MANPPHLADNYTLEMNRYVLLFYFIFESADLLLYLDSTQPIRQGYTDALVHLEVADLTLATECDH